MSKILLETINALSRRQSNQQSVDPKDTLRDILLTAIDLLDAEVGVIYSIRPNLHNQRHTKFVYPPIIEGDLQQANQVRFNRPGLGGIIDKIINERLFVVENLDLEPEFQRYFTTDEGICSFIGVAIMEEQSDEPLAVLFLNYRTLRTFSQEEQDNLLVFAGYASVLLQRRRRDQRYRIVQDIGQQITQELQPPQILFPRLHRLTQKLFLKQYSFMLADYNAQEDTFNLYLNDRGKNKVVEKHALQGGCCRHVLFDPAFSDGEKRSWLINHYSEEQNKPGFPAQLVRVSEEEGIDPESCIFVPMFLRGKPLGVLTVQALKPHVYTDEDAQVLELLGTHVALALNSMRLFKDLRELRKFGKLLTGQYPPNYLLRLVANRIRRATGADLTVLYPYWPDDQKFDRPWISGQQKDPDFPIGIPTDPEDIAHLLLKYEKPIWADQSADLYVKLGREEGSKSRNFIHREQIVSTAALPLLVRKEQEGVLFINFRHPQRFDASQKEMIKALAGYAAIAIRNARMFGEKEQRRIEELNALLEVDLAITQTLDLDQVLRKIVEQALELQRVQVDRAVLWLYNARNNELVPNAPIGFPEDKPDKLPLSEAKGIVLYAFLEGETVLVDDVKTDPEFSDLYIEASEDTVSEAAIPLSDGEEVIGVLHFESNAAAAFPPDSRFFLDSLAAQAVVAIKNAQEREALIEIGEQITSELDINTIFDLILGEVLKITRCRYGNLMRYDERRDLLETAAVHGKPTGEQRWTQQIGEGVIGWVAQHKAYRNIPELAELQDINYVKRIEGMRSELAVPIVKDDGRVLGVINAENEAPNHFSERDVSMVKALAVLARVAIENAEAYDTQQRTAKVNQTLIEIGKELTQELDAVPLFALILDRAMDRLEAKVGHVWIYDVERRDLGIVTESAPEHMRDIRIPFGTGVVGGVAATKQARVIADVGPLKRQPGAYVEIYPGMHSEVAVPIIGENEQLLGVINASSDKLGRFTEEHKRFLEALADQAAIAMQNATQRRKLEILNNVSRQIAKQLGDSDKVMRTLLLGARELTRADLAELDLYEKDKRVRTYFIKQGGGDPVDRLYRLDDPVADHSQGNIVRGLMEWVAQERKPFFSEGDVRDHPRYVALPEDENIVSEAALPLLSGGELIGVLNVESTRPNAFGKEERENLEIFANRAVIAIQNARNYDKADRAAQRFRSLYEAGQELGKVEDSFGIGEDLDDKLKQAYQIILKTAEKHFQCEVTIRRYSSYLEEVVLVDSNHRQEHDLFTKMRLGEGANGIVAQYHVDLQSGMVAFNDEDYKKMDPLVIHDVENPPPGTIPKPSDPETKTLVIAPIKYSQHARYYGNLSLGHTVKDHFKDADIDLLTGLAKELAITIRRLDAAQAEERQREIELMSFAGQYALELAHRINSDLGGISDYITDARSSFSDGNEAMFEENLQQIKNEVDSVKGLVKSYAKETTDEKDLRDEKAIPLPLIVLVRELLVDLGLPAEQAETLEKLEGKVRPNPDDIPDNIDLVLHIQTMRSDLQDSDEDEKLLVLFAPKQFIAIIRDLVLNGVQAIQETGQDRGTVEMKTVERDNFIELQVKDNGKGILRQNWEKIFGLFYSTKGSSGFGLWSARRYARINGGELEVLASAKGNGTTFSLHVPKAP